jgi:putative ABC transport system substrate-binding protein
MKTGSRGGWQRGKERLQLCVTVFLVAGTITGWPFAVGAQQPAKVWRVGWIWPGGRAAGNSTEVAGFRQGLNELGYIEGKNIVVEYRFGEGQRDRTPNFVAELVRLRPDVLVALGDLTVRAIKAATATIPVVSMTGDPVGLGLVASLARPGGNITGVSMMHGEEGLAGKRVELLKDVLPSATRIGLVFYPGNPTTARSLAQADEVATRLGLIMHPLPVGEDDELAAAIEAVAREGVDAVEIEPVAPFTSYPQEAGELLLKHRVPAVSELRRIAESGGLISYGPDLFDATRRLAYFVDRILKGTKPADLPVEQPTTFGLVVNLKTAKALGLTIPPSILARADEVIE